MHIPDDPMSTAKHRQTYTHPGTINATETCNAVIDGPRTHDCKSNTKSIIIIYIKAGFYWKVWENKWVFNCDFNEEYVCAQQMEKDYSRLQDPDGRKISGLSTSF